MTGADTNVLVRYFVRDDPDQAARADEWIDRVRQAEDKVFINSIVLCETVWVLTSVYKHPRDVLAGIIDRMLNTVHFEVENHAIVQAALNDFRLSGADFADCLIGRINSDAGCARTVSFDRATARLPHFEIL